MLVVIQVQFCHPFIGRKSFVWFQETDLFSEDLVPFLYDLEEMKTKIWPDDMDLVEFNRSEASLLLDKIVHHFFKVVYSNKYVFRLPLC